MRGGIDKGWCFEFRRLSDRRKFIRACWVVPVGLTALVPYQVLGLPAWVAELFALRWEDRCAWYAIGGWTAAAVGNATYYYARWWRDADPPGPVP